VILSYFGQVDGRRPALAGLPSLSSVRTNPQISGRMHPMRTALLYLFHCPGSAIYAISDDQTGSSVRKHNPDTKFLLRAEVVRSEVPPAVLVSINQVGYCLLDEYEIQNTQPRWLLRDQH
jgi:hypothetical protein